MTLFQTIMITLMATGFVVSVGFTIAFLVEVIRGPKVIKSTRIRKVEVQKAESKEQENIRRMLAQLEKEAEEEAEVRRPSVSKVEPREEIVIEQVAPVLVDKEPEEELIEIVEQPKKQELKEESKPAIEKFAPIEDEEDFEEDFEEDYEEEVEETPKTIVIEKVTTETVGTDFDYSVRLAKIIESKNKMERDLQKTKRAITKYERTQRRRTRNQKMLDRRAVELTNLNLMMYSVTDIKNIDADKKAKQEELTTHIAELKASIQDADAFLAKNKERYEHDKKMFAFYTKEEARYNDEIKELEILIKNANNVTGSTTTTTTTTTTGAAS